MVEDGLRVFGERDGEDASRRFKCATASRFANAEKPQAFA